MHISVLIIASLILILTGCGKNIDAMKIQEREGLLYEPNSSTPYSGSVSNYLPITLEKGGKVKPTKVLEYIVKNGLRNGKYTKWHPNGQIKRETHYNQGKSDGKDTWWHENGQKRSEYSMTAGVLDGKATSWHDNGQLESEKLYVDNNIHGKWIEWYENGQKKEELNYNYGEPDGSQTSWEMNGDESNKTIYKNGKITHMYYRGYLTVSPPEIAGLNK